ncbi:ArsR/SmtB family transcription factor [Paracoccus sp. p3-h83]|uniref:ArsR/SmtB family transcription factor n=1 Tax=Paracoccus sp. p3-h83 TaxID=3342805 RepID=UPI0035B8DEE1
MPDAPPLTDQSASAGFAALAQPSRLALLRRLIAAGPDGMAAGDLAAAVGMAPPLLSFHLGQLAAAGLVRARRQGRFVIHAADLGAVGALIGFLVDDCCDGHPEVCAALPPTLLPPTLLPQARGCR